MKKDQVSQIQPSCMSGKWLMQTFHKIQTQRKIQPINHYLVSGRHYSEL